MRGIKSTISISLVTCILHGQSHHSSERCSEQTWSNKHSEVGWLLRSSPGFLPPSRRHLVLSFILRCLKSCLLTFTPCTHFIFSSRLSVTSFSLSSPVLASCPLCQPSSQVRFPLCHMVSSQAKKLETRHFELE